MSATHSTPAHQTTLSQEGIDRLWRALVAIQLEDDHLAGLHWDAVVIGCTFCGRLGR